MSKVAVIVGGGLGDEGKGKITCYYLNEYNMGKEVLCIRSSGGTNTGATVYRNDKKIQVHMLPVGVFMPGGKHGYIGSAVYLNLRVLEDELKLMDKYMDYDDDNRPIRKLYISKYAHVVTEDDITDDLCKESEQNYGSTKNGVSIAAGKKYRYEGLTLQQLIDSPEHTSSTSDYLQYILQMYNINIVDPYDFFTKIVEPNDWNIVIEGTQGIELDVNHGPQYPYVSCGSFSTYGLLDGVGYTLAPTEVVMCIKAYGSYFGPKRMGDLDFEDDDFRKFAGEYGTTTKRPRNLYWLDIEQIKRNAQLIKPTTLVINHIDSLNYFANNNKHWKIFDYHKQYGFTNDSFINNKLTGDGHKFVKMLKKAAKVQKVLLGYGPLTYDIKKYNAKIL